MVLNLPALMNTIFHNSNNSSRSGGGDSTILDPKDSDIVFAIYRADSDENTISTFTSAFIADVANNKITTTVTPSPDFSAATGYPPVASSSSFSQLGQACPVYFSSTGTLPAPLVADTPYLLSAASGGGYKIFPYATESDIGTFLQSAITKENVLFAQRYYEGLYPLTISDTGSGTHTVSTIVPSVSFIEDLKSGLFGMFPTNADNNRNAHFPLKTDGDGDMYFESREINKIDYSGSSQTPYGTQLQVLANKVAGNAIVSEKRTLAIIALCSISESDTRQYVKQTSDSTRVNTTTNVITINLSIDDESTVRFSTAQPVKLQAMPSATLPTGLDSSTTYYVRVSGSTITLHPTASDATNNTNIVDITGTGSGGFTIYVPSMPGSLQRGNFLVEWIEPLNNGGNSLSPRLSPTYEAGNYNTTNFVTSGGSNGNCNSFVGATGDKIKFWVPVGSSLPSGLTEGTIYYVNRPNPASGTCTLHTTLVDALVGTNKITFSGAGTGTVQAQWADGKSEMVLGTYLGSETDIMGHRFEYDKKQVMVMLVDYNPADASTPVGWFGINEPRTVQKAIAGTKGILPTATTKTGNPWTVFNAAQAHRPINENLYYMAMIASPDDIDYNTIAKMVNWLGEEYTIPDFTPVDLLEYTIPDAPTIVNCVGGNGKITVNFTPGFNGNVAYTDFKAKYRVNGTTGAYTTFSDGTSTSNTIVIENGDIVNGTVFEVVVSGVNSIGEGPNSSSATATPTALITSPTEISGLNLWIDASDAASFTELAGIVTTITDKSTAGNNPQSVASIGTGTRTIDSKNVFDFNGSTSELFHSEAFEALGNNDYTLFWMFASDVAGGNSTTRTLLSGTTAANQSRLIVHWQSGNARVRFANNVNSGTGITLDGSITPNTNPHVLMARRNGADLSIGWDGAIIATGVGYANNVTITSAATGRQAVSGGDRLDGPLGEIVGYNRALTNSEASQVADYLLDKWGLV
jgi:hypothetical protein